MMCDLRCQKLPAPKHRLWCTPWDQTDHGRIPGRLNEAARRSA